MTIFFYENFIQLETKKQESNNNIFQLIRTSLVLNVKFYNFNFLERKP